MPFGGAFLASIGSECICINPAWRTGTATVTRRTIGEQSTAPESIAHQIRVHIAVDEVARGSDLRSGHSISEVTARVRRRCVELQTLGGEVRQVSHKPLWVFPECAASIGV